jgi:hypothetical protein
MSPNGSHFQYYKMPYSKRSQLNSIQNMSRRISEEDNNKIDLAEEERQRIVNT